MRRSNRPRRRDLLKALPGLGLAALVPGLARGQATVSEHVSEHKFLFIVAYGGWDTTAVFTPVFDNPAVDNEADATTAEFGDLRFVDHPARPAVRNFFDRWGEQSCLINGIEVRSVTHEACKRILLTGSAGASGDDWPSLLAARSRNELALPHLVVYGSAITTQHVSDVVRVGSHGQLLDLLDGTALSQSGLDPNALPSDVDALIDQALAERVADYANERTGSASRFGTNYGRALEGLGTLEGLADDLNLVAVGTGCSRDAAEDAGIVLDAFERGLSRCGMVEDDGWCGEGWDTHANNGLQSTNFELLFGYLDQIMTDLQSRSSPSGGALADEVTVVVLSEMGRHPQLNAGGGRDHWTFTSALLLGSGVQGGQVIGAMDENFQGLPVDLRTGELRSDGTGLVPGHLGATLLALGGEDPGQVLSGGYEPIEGALL
jgi:hypothetical protein